MRVELFKFLSLTGQKVRVEKFWNVRMDVYDIDRDGNVASQLQSKELGFITHEEMEKCCKSKKKC